MATVKSIVSVSPSSQLLTAILLSAVQQIQTLKIMHSHLTVRDTSAMHLLLYVQEKELHTQCFTLLLVTLWAQAEEGAQLCYSDNLMYVAVWVQSV